MAPANFAGIAAAARFMKTRPEPGSQGAMEILTRTPKPFHCQAQRPSPVAGRVRRAMTLNPKALAPEPQRIRDSQAAA
jgi:hypothetical protein